MDNVIPLSAVNVGIRRLGRQLLDVADLSIGHSGCTLIVGPNGAGKSLLIRALCDLQACDYGQVRWAGKKPNRQMRHQVGMLLQRPVLLRRSSLDNLVFALLQTGESKKHARILATEALHKAGLSQVAQVPAQKLSGGEQQRVALARALLLKPQVLLLDEATANVDPASTYVIEQQLLESVEAGVSVVMVSHDIGQVKRLATDVLLMHQGQVIEYCSRDTFFNRPGNPLTLRWIAGELLV